MLHIRRFGFRVISYLESYTMFVASTINLLDFKEGINREGARARLALTFEVFRNAKSTPSNVRCAEIIEQLLRKNETPTQSDGAGGVGDFGNADALAANSGPANSIQTTAALPALSNEASDLVDDLGYVGIAPFDEPFGAALSGLGAMTPAQEGVADVEMPVRWLPENIGDDHAWMMMSMDFG